MTAGTRLRDAQRAVLVASQPGSSVSLCDPVLAVLPVQGAAVSLFTGSMDHTTLCASDAVAARLDELQFDLGEGPCWEALDTRTPVLVPDLLAGGGTSWPYFRAAARGVGAGAVFAFPLFVKTLDIGALNVYCDSPGRLTDAAAADACALAETMSLALLRRLTVEVREDSARGWERDSASSRQEVHQATGMLTVQLSTDVDGAFAMLRAHALTAGRPVLEVSRDIVARRLRLDEAR